MTYPKEKFHWPPPGSTPEQAPWQEVEALINGLGLLINGMGLVTAKLDALLSALQAITPAVPAAPGAPAAPSIAAVATVVTQLTTGPTVEILRRAFSDLVGLSNSEVIDLTKGTTLLIKVESTLDQAVSLQPMGNIVNAIDKSTPIGLPVALPAQGNTTIIISQAFWHSYIWVRVTPVVAPAQGNLVITYAIHG